MPAAIVFGHGSRSATTRRILGGTGTFMRAAYYEANGAARDVLRVGDVDTPAPGAGEVRIRIAASGVNPSDVKSREGRTRKIAFPRVIPHSDAGGTIDAVGSG